MTGNTLLAQFPAQGRVMIEPHLRRTTHEAGEVIRDIGEETPQVFFPTSGLLSSVIILKDGAVAEAATIGREGVAGLESLVGESCSPCRIVQQVPGELLALPAETLCAAIAESPGVRRVLDRFFVTLALQYAQNAACNLHHRIEARLCRWLLSTADRLGREGFGVTQELISELLGVSRQSVSQTAGQLQQAGLITYRRGNVRITDRGGLEQASCECYGTTRDAYRRLMRISAA